MREAYTQLYAGARQTGHAIIEKLRRPVGESSVPSRFIIASRHVKEVLENLYDEKNLIDEQWEVRRHFLKQTLTFRYTNSRHTRYDNHILYDLRVVSPTHTLSHRSSPGSLMSAMPSCSPTMG